MEVLSRGCRRPKSALMPASELFVHGEFVLYQSNDRHTLTSCALEDTFYPLRLDPYRLTCASYMTALCHAAAQPDEPAAELYALLLKGLYLLAYVEDTDALGLTAAFLLLFADAIGYRPRLGRCAHCRTAPGYVVRGKAGYRGGRAVLPGLRLTRDISAERRTNCMDEGYACGRSEWRQQKNRRGHAV